MTHEESEEFPFFAAHYLAHLKRAVDAISVHDMYRAVLAIRYCKGTVWLIGNGGSAALASHMATDLQLAGVRACTLTDVAAITTYANDSHFNDSFAFQINRLFKASDLLIAISGSGNSANITYAAGTVQRYGGKVIGITGWDGGFLARCCNIHLNVPAHHMGQAQDGHQIILHIICYFLMEKLKNEKTTRTPVYHNVAHDSPVLQQLDDWLDGKHDNLGTGVL